MNNRQIISVLVAMVLVAVGVFVTYNNRASRTEKEAGKEIGSKLVPSFPLNEVDRHPGQNGQGRGQSRPCRKRPGESRSATTIRRITIT